MTILGKIGFLIALASLWVALAAIPHAAAKSTGCKWFYLGYIPVTGALLVLADAIIRFTNQ